MSASVKIDVLKFFEECLLDRLFLSTQGLFIKKMFGREVSSFNLHFHSKKYCEF
jgi:hypothetical protein